MKESGIDISVQELTKLKQNTLDLVDIVVTVCDHNQPDKLHKIY